MDVALPPLSIEKLPSGLTLLAVHKRGLPLFHARLSLPAGASEDPRGKAGLAQFTLDLLRRGTRRRPAQDVDDLIESMGAHLAADVSMEEAALALTVPAELADRALGTAGSRAGTGLRGERGLRRPPPHRRCVAERSGRAEHRGRPRRRDPRVRGGSSLRAPGAWFPPRRGKLPPRRCARLSCDAIPPVRCSAGAGGAAGTGRPRRSGTAQVVAVAAFLARRVATSSAAVFRPSAGRRPARRDRPQARRDAGAGPHRRGRQEAQAFHSAGFTQEPVRQAIAPLSTRAR